MKISFVKFGGLATGGTERFIQTIAANLNRSKFDVKYFYCDSAPYIGSDWRHPDTDANRLNYMTSKNVDLIKFNVGFKDVRTHTHDWVNTNFWDLYKESDYDILQTGRAGHPEYPFTLLRKINIVDALTLARMVDNQENIKKVIVASSWQATEWINCGGNRNKLVVVPLFRERLPTPSDTQKDTSKTVFGFHQRNDDNIFSPIPLQAYSKIENENTSFILLGGGESYRKQAIELKLKNCIFIDHAGDERAISNFLNKLDVYTHGRSDGETYSVAIAEAMSQGLPIISHLATCNGHVDTIGSGGVVTDSVQSYYENMKLLLENKELRLELGYKAKQEYDERLSLEKNIKIIEDIYEEIL